MCKRNHLFLRKEMITSRAQQRGGIRVSRPAPIENSESHATSSKIPPEHIRLTDPNVFGPGKWDDMHTFGAAATTPDLKKSYCDYIRIITSSLKCMVCRKHAIEYVRDHPPEEFLNVLDENGQDIGLFKWSWLFHNAVNKRISKPEVDFKVAYAMYEPESAVSNSVCVENCGDQAAPPGPDQITAELNRSAISGAASTAVSTAISSLPEYTYSALGRSVEAGNKVTDEVSYIPTYSRLPSPKRNAGIKIKSR